MVLQFYLQNYSAWLQFTSDEKGNEVEEFFSTRTKPFIARTIKQCVERVRNNANWARSIKSDNSLGDVVNGLLAHKA